ncbi:hypothetical protein BV25DRAFT_1919501 [Artomyces pyxidatus]|uniref:Uncharacterized protein n=1 Tax=Artomyces pyxidatus TaxID=48021 RepID=A0ACB8SQR6_9AGAM|nr:hypothetical protein BV25DRAFT_1919501 [Artomyces pyxidatus]
MPARVTCRGCGKKFQKASSLNQHLAKSNKPECVAARRQGLAYVERGARAPSPRPPAREAAGASDRANDDAMEVDIETPAAHEDQDPHIEMEVDAPGPAFQGDYFGVDYQPHDFDWNEADDEAAAQADEMGPPDADDEDLDDPEAINLTFEPDPAFSAPQHSPPRDPPSPPRPDEQAEEIGANAAGGNDGGQAGAGDQAEDGDAGNEDEDALWQEPVIVPFLSGHAGAPMGQEELATYQEYERLLGEADADNAYRPFPDKGAWDIADWAKELGPTSNAFTKLMRIDTVRDNLDLPYRTAQDLNEIIDKKLPARPAFKREYVVVAGEKYPLYYRDPLECIKALYGDPEFAPYLTFAPQRHYVDDDQTIRLYSDMYTGKWWWRTQSAYPIYLTLGNIPKEIRRKPSRGAQILVGYLPTTGLTHIKNRDTRRRAVANLFHACVRRIMETLREPGLNGIPMASSDGVIRRCHPLFAAFVGDYPEQCLVAGCKNMECPQGCDLTRTDLGRYCTFDRLDTDKIRDALAMADENPQDYVEVCKEARIKPIYHPFWEDLPYVDIHNAITPDVLHQLYQGMVKHVVSWLKKAYGAEEIDARFSRLPQNHNLRLFSSGISHLSRVSGQEHKDICRVLLGVIVDLPLPGALSPVRLIRAVRGLLDYVYIAQYPSHSSVTLTYLDDALAQFHANKGILLDLGIRENFNLPKLHSMLHFSDKIKQFGTTDNYSTETTERLHIDFAKDAYRATNHKDEYPQMTLWLQRREKMRRHAQVIRWRLAGRKPVTNDRPENPAKKLRIKITRFPSVKAVSFANAALLYGARDFKEHLSEFILQHNNPLLNPRQVKQLAATYTPPFRSVAVFHKVKFWNPDAQGREEAPETLDVVHARPAYRDTQGRVQPGRFDTALVEERQAAGDEEERHGVKGQRVGQVRMVFRLSETASEHTFDPEVTAPDHLAYVEWFTKFKPAPEDNHEMYRIARAYENQGERRMVSILPVNKLVRSVHLIPRFGPEAARDWTSGNVLELCEAFYVNSFTDRHTYLTVY